MTKPRRRSRRTSKLGPNSGERDARGRFQKGNRAARGNKGQRDRAALRRVLAASVTDDDLEAVVERAVRQAKRGDRHARRFLAERLDGLPSRASSPPIQVPGLPEVVDAASATRALGALVARVAAGELSPDEAQAVARLIGEARRTAADAAGWAGGFDPEDSPPPTFL